MNLDKKNLTKILIKINPKIKPYINKKNINLIDNGLLDSLMVINLIQEIQNITRKKIKISTVNRGSFANIDNILKYFNK